MRGKRKHCLVISYHPILFCCAFKTRSLQQAAIVSWLLVTTNYYRIYRSIKLECIDDIPG